jgi:hypothetical protein
MGSYGDMLDVHGKLVKYVVHLSKRKKTEKNYFFFTHATQKLQSTNFWSQGILGVKFIFHVFFEELLHATMWLKLPMG